MSDFPLLGPGRSLGTSRRALFIAIYKGGMFPVCAIDPIGSIDPTHKCQIFPFWGPGRSLGTSRRAKRNTCTTHVHTSL